jgi:hypothetical protein
VLTKSGLTNPSLCSTTVNQSKRSAGHVSWPAAHTDPTPRDSRATSTAVLVYQSRAQHRWAWGPFNIQALTPHRYPQTPRAWQIKGDPRKLQKPHIWSRCIEYTVANILSYIPSRDTVLDSIIHHPKTKQVRVQTLKSV